MLAFLTTAVLAVGMLAAGTTAASAADVPTISVTEIPDGGGTVTVTGAGFSTTAPGIYVGIGAAGARNFYSANVTGAVWLNVGNDTTATQAPLNSDGTFTLEMTLPAEDTTAWAIYTAKAQGLGAGADTTQNTQTALSYAEPVVVTPPVVTPPVVTPPTVTPEVSVTEIPDGGGTVTVTGTGFSTTAPGIYVGIGVAGARNFYSANATGAVWLNVGNDTTATQAPLNSDGSFALEMTVPADDGTSWAIYTAKAQGLGAGADTTQNTQTVLSYAEPVVVTPPVVTPPVVTPPTTEEPVTSDPDVEEPETEQPDTDSPVVITPDTGNGPTLGYTSVTSDGGTITVSGTGFTAASPGIYLGLAPRGLAGFYAASDSLIEGQTVHISVTNTVGETAAGRTAPMNADGTFSVEITIPAESDVDYALYTSKAHGQGLADVSQDVVLDFDYNTVVSLTPTTPVDGGEGTPPVVVPVDGTPVVLEPVTEPTAEPVVETAAPAAAPVVTCLARTVSGASLNWAIKDSFRSYISGGIANGSWDLSSVGDSNGQFIWSNGTGSYNGSASRGTVSFPGTVHFTGHDGQLDITLTGVKVRVDTATSATVIASFDTLGFDGVRTSQSNVAFATVSMGGVSTSSSTLSFEGATTLTTAGATAFGGFYDAGTALAPLTVSAPLGGATECTTSTGTTTALATTGTDDLGSGLIAAFLLVMAGLGGLSIARRRSAAKGLTVSS